MDTTKEPVEGKVWGATVGTGTGAAVSTFILWLLGVLVFGASPSADNAADAVTAVPYPILGIVALAITVGGSFVGGYVTKHTPRLADSFESYVEPQVLDVEDPDENVADQHSLYMYNAVDADAEIEPKDVEDDEEVVPEDIKPQGTAP